MKAIAKSGILLTTAMVMDAATTGGTGILTVLGITEIVRIAANSGGDVLSGLSAQLLNSGFQNSSLERAFSKAVQETLKNVQNEYFEQEKIIVDKWRNLSIEYGFDIPKLNEPTLIAKSLKTNFFIPLEKALKDPERVESILTKQKEINLSGFFTELISELNIQLPSHRIEHQEKIELALINSFQNSFQKEFTSKLLLNDRAQRSYQLLLLQSTISYLTNIDADVSDLKLIQKEILHEFQLVNDTVISEIKKNYRLHLITYKKKYDLEIDIQDQFRYEMLFTEFQGREKELSILTDFVKSDSKFCFYAINGPGGSGKSRLANEICLNPHLSDWYCGFYEKKNNENINWIAFEPEIDTLIIIDYASNEKDEVNHILTSLGKKEYEDESSRIRVLLIDREFTQDVKKSIFTSQTRYRYYCFKSNKEPQPLVLGPLETKAQWNIIKQVLSHDNSDASIDILLKNQDEIMEALQQHDDLGRPLFTFFSAVALKEGKTIDEISKWNTNDNLRHQLDRIEDKFWSRSTFWSEHTKDLKNLILIGTMIEGFTDETLHYTLSLPIFKDLSPLSEDESFWLAIKELIDNDDLARFGGIKPDILGEFYITARIGELSKHPALKSQLTQLYEAAWIISPRNTFWMSILTFSDYIGDFHLFSDYGDWLKKAIVPGQEASFGNLLFAIANYLDQDNQIDLAIDYYNASMERGNIFSLHNLGTHYAGQGEKQLAEKYYLKAIDGGFAPSLSSLAFLYKEDNQYELAIKYYLLAIENGDEEFLFTIGMLFHKIGEFESAEKYLLLAAKNGDKYAMYNLGFLYEEHGRNDEAIQFLLQATEHGYSAALNKLALLYLNENKEDLAVKYFLTAIDKGEKGAYDLLAGIYKEKGEPETAIKYCLKGIENGDIDSLDHLALLYMSQGKNDLAIKYWLMGCEKGHTKSMCNLGALYGTLGQIEMSKTYLLLASENGDTTALFNLASIYNQQGDAESTRKYLKLGAEKGHGRAAFNLAVIYDDENQKEQAIEFYKIAINADYTEAIIGLSNLYYGAGRADLAIEYLLAGIDKKDPEDPNTGEYFETLCHNLGLMYLENGQKYAAIKFLLMAYENGNEDSIVPLTQLCLLVGHSQARSLLDQLFEYYSEDSPALSLLWFYRYAYFHNEYLDTALSKTENFSDKNIQVLDLYITEHIKAAIKNGHPFPSNVKKFGLLFSPNEDIVKHDYLFTDQTDEMNEDFWDDFEEFNEDDFEEL